LSPHELNTLHIIHVGSVLVLIAFTFYGFSAALETRKKVLSISGIAALLVLVTGIRLWQGLYGFAPVGWVFVKLVCWVGIAALGGMAYRKRELTGALMLIVLFLAFTALAMVYVKPF
jgi:hypothetical protein